ncbi:hypothetical protein ACIA8G_35250 [Lentzea sp. NPDC051213]|uniref:hypothetical protein n=1 Tax=Lentzea sp. NPDC051213 TaxID=3364126 RepID=UPI0037944799
MTGGRPVLAPGDQVHFDGEQHQVLALSSTSVRLRSTEGTEQVVLAGYMMSAPDFAVLGATALPAVEPIGLLDALPADVLAAARDWERHVVEVETGLPLGAEPGAVPRPGFDPAVHTLAERDRAKASELGVSVRTVQGRRARYAAQGLWGLVDQRATRTWEVTGRADPRLVEAALEVIAAETSASTGTRSRLMRRVVKRWRRSTAPTWCRFRAGRRSTSCWSGSPLASTRSARRSPAGRWPTVRRRCSRRPRRAGPVSRSRSTPRRST